jgi:prepilin peptidase CpaA
VSGKTDFITVAVLVLAALAACLDLAYGRVFNWLTLSLAVGGIVYSGVAGGAAGLGASLLGILAGLVLYGWMFRIGVLGGGDVKLLMAFGAWGGARFTLDVAILGVLLGGVMSILLLTAKGKIGAFFRKSYRSLISLVVKELEVEKFQIDRKQTMPFGVPIAAAAAWIRLRGAPW